MKILFYEDRYYLLSNWSAHMVEYKGVVYPTAEHAYHCQRFTDDKIIAAIRDSRSPNEAKEITYQNLEAQLSNWNEIKLQIMYEVVLSKAKQHKEVSDILISTGDAVLIENSPVDYFWGCGKDGTGRNELGKIWMKVRQELMA